MNYATLATPLRGIDLWMKRVNQRIAEEDARIAKDAQAQEQQTAKRRKVDFSQPAHLDATIETSACVVKTAPHFVLSDSQKRLCALRTQAGLAYGYWHSKYCQKLPDQVRSEKLEDFLDRHLLPYLKGDDDFAKRIAFLAFSFDFSSPAAFLKEMHISPQKLFEFILS
jgi:hypothetical protein